MIPPSVPPAFVTLHLAIAFLSAAQLVCALDVHFAGASPDIAAPGGIRPLHLACAGPITTSSTRSKVCLSHFYDQQQLWKKAGAGSSAIVKLLLASGADQTSRTASGATGLHIAANSGSADVVADLLESSEDVDPDDDGAYNCESRLLCPMFEPGLSLLLFNLLVCCRLQ
jgi:hypothetical protein